jgi:hypothetical protein
MSVMTPTMRLRYVRRVPPSTDSNPLPRMILQQYWEDGWRQQGEWRDVVTEEEA